MPQVEALECRPDLVRPELRGEGAHRGQRVHDKIIAEVDGAAVEGGHLGLEGGDGLETLLGRIAHRASRRDHSSIRV